MVPTRFLGEEDMRFGARGSIVGFGVWGVGLF